MEYLTVQEAADQLRVAPITVRRYIAQGRLAAVRIGRGVRVEKEALERLPEPIHPGLKPPKRRKPRYFSMDDAIWELAGIGIEDEATDVSSNKHKYLADAYAAKSE
jgi:excisionase family DNA binding protein